MSRRVRLTAKLGTSISTATQVGFCGSANDETQAFQQRDHLAGLKNGNVPHDSRDRDVLNPNKFRFEHRLAIFEEHRYDLVKIGVQLVERFALGVSTGKPRNEPNKEARLSVSSPSR